MRIILVIFSVALKKKSMLVVGTSKQKLDHEYIIIYVVGSQRVVIFLQNHFRAVWCSLFFECDFCVFTL